MTGRHYHTLPVLALLVICFICTFAPRQVFAIEMSLKPGAPITMEADTLSYDQKGDFITLEGTVRILYEDTILQADKVIYYDKTKDVKAEGRVVLTEGEDVLRCDRLELNVETKKGIVYQGKVFLKQKNFHITGSKLEKLGEAEYRVHDATLTSCDAKIPYWMFTVKELDVEVEGIGQGWWAGFRVLDIPVLYFPWAAFPVKRDRQSGFLFPDFGSSSKWGPEFKLPFYWAIAPNQDATFYAERIGDKRGRGFKEGAEYRYAWSTDAQGKISGNYIWDERGDQTRWWDDRQDKSRWSIFAEHDQNLGDGYYFKTNVNYVSDKNYTVDFSSDLPEETRIDASSRNQLESTVTAGKNWQWGALETDAYYFRTLYFPREFIFQNPALIPPPILSPTDDTFMLRADDNGATMQMLPQMNFSLYQDRLLETPIFYEMEFQGTNYWRQDFPSFTAPAPPPPPPPPLGPYPPPPFGGREVLRGGRVDLYPRISLPFKPFDIVRVEPWAGYRETIYFPVNDPLGRLRDVTSREIFDAGASVATTISRVFPVNWGRVRGLEHIMEPKVIYTYIPFVNQADNADFTRQVSNSVLQMDNPHFNDGIDTITGQNTVTWMLTNYLIGKDVDKDGKVTYPEYLYLKMYQSYNFSPDVTRNLAPLLFPKANRPFFVPPVSPMEPHHLSNLVAEARITPHLSPSLWLSGSMDLQYNPSDNRFDTLNAGVGFFDSRGDKMGVQYRFTRTLPIDPDGLLPPVSAEEINAALALHIIKPLDLFFEYRYDLRDQTRIETVYGVDFRQQCWEVSVRVHDINRQPQTDLTSSSSELKVMVFLTLTGLGKYRVK